MTNKRTYAARRIEWQRALAGPRGTAGEYIRRLAEINAQSVVLFCRVSRTDQRTHLDDQQNALTKEAESRGLAVAKVIRSIGSGAGSDRTALEVAIELARENEAVVLAESTDRFLRAADYSKKNQHRTASVSEFEQLAELADGVTLATMIDPDMTPGEVRGYQTKRGQHASGTKGGRPRKIRPGYKKARRLEKQPEVLKLRGQGRTLKQISEITGVPVRTVCYWIMRKKNCKSG